MHVEASCTVDVPKSYYQAVQIALCYSARRNAGGRSSNPGRDISVSGALVEDGDDL
jgi:hypothetical protein